MQENMVQETIRNPKAIISLLTAVTGIIFYLAWNLTYGAWADIGIYSVTAVLVCLGVAGWLIATMPDTEEER
ncbi:MAG: hypothetical protein R6U10_06570 [Thermoplasmatota archaeon]